MIIAWDDSLSTGIEEIDAQHKDLIKLMQRLYILQQKDFAREFIFRILQELEKLTEYHFLSEETLMLLLQYPLAKTQQAEHRKLLRVLVANIRAVEDNVKPLDEVLGFLFGWLKSHIKEEDMGIRNYIDTQGLKIEY